MAIRIIGGDKKGFFVKGPKGVKTRPILARVRKSLFDILRPCITGSNFLDLYSGSGSVGIEAVSRGSEHVVFVEKDKKVCVCLKGNIEHCRVGDVSTLVCGDVFRFINTAQEKFDIIFAGPPYSVLLADKTLHELSDSSILKENTIVIIQHSIKEKIDETTHCLKMYRQERYGETTLSFFSMRRII
ncbi:16S rRNA (guanine(966)-N(2))-methyltransferase RsmD [bacterium]